MAIPVFSSTRGSGTSISRTPAASSPMVMKSIVLIFIVVVGATWHRTSTSSVAVSRKGSEKFTAPLAALDVCTKEFCQEQNLCPETPAVSADVTASDMCTPSYCRENVFVPHGGGGVGVMPPEKVATICSSPNLFGACEELKDFTGLSSIELATRLERHNVHHFESEHIFWNPQTTTELRWYYATSIDYLFANTLHPSHGRLRYLNPNKHQPVLDYSSGVGNNILYLTSRGLKCKYFGIGQMERSFAEYRFRKRGLLSGNATHEPMVTLLDPWAAQSGWKMDPMSEHVLPRDRSLGAILAVDVLEHIPNYHKVVEAMVDSLRVGGVILEQSPFDNSEAQDTSEGDVRIHVSDGGVKMSEAMGPRMKRLPTAEGYWTKISN